MSAKYLQFLENTLPNTNIQAMLKTIRKSEGTDAPDGYSYLFGSSPKNKLRFSGFSDHPHIEEPFGKQFSSAAGAYQILFPTWENIQKSISLPDFTPHSQDIACEWLISEVNCLELIVNGKFYEAEKKCATIWASLPFSIYGQPVHTIDQVVGWYKNYGGIISD